VARSSPPLGGRPLDAGERDIQWSSLQPMGSGGRVARAPLSRRIKICSSSGHSFPLINGTNNYISISCVVLAEQKEKWPRRRCSRPPASSARPSSAASASMPVAASPCAGPSRACPRASGNNAFDRLSSLPHSSAFFPLEKKTYHSLTNNTYMDEMELQVWA
jgi:hypothetical protein